MKPAILLASLIAAWLSGFLCGAWVCAMSQREERLRGHSGVVCIEPSCGNDSGTGNLYCPEHGGDDYEFCGEVERAMVCVMARHLNRGRTPEWAARCLGHRIGRVG